MNLNEDCVCMCKAEADGVGVGVRLMRRRQAARSWSASFAQESGKMQLACWFFPPYEELLIDAEYIQLSLTITIITATVAGLQVHMSRYRWMIQETVASWHALLTFEGSPRATPIPRTLIISMLQLSCNRLRLCWR